MGQPASSGRYRSLDSLRGLVILWIVLFHILDTYQEQYGRAFYAFMTLSDFRVHALILISGFGVAAAIEKAMASGVSWLDFLKRRLWRIYIPYWFSVLFAGWLIPWTCAWLASLKGHDPAAYLVSYSWVEWLQVATLTKVFTATSWQLNKAFKPMNGAIWFLAVLVQMYVVMALAMRSRRYHLVMVIVTIIAWLTVIPQVRAWVPYGIFLPYWIGFSVGMGLFYVLRRGFVLRVRSRREYALYAGMLASYLLGSIAVLSWFPRAWLFVLAFGGLLWLLYPIDARLTTTRVFRWCAFLGMFSYSLYLLHVPLEPLMSMLARNLTPLPPHLADPLLVIPAIVVISYGWSRVFERPFHPSRQVRRF